MRYADNRVVKTGDLVCVRGRGLGVVGCVVDSGDYTRDFPRGEYSYLGSGLMVGLGGGGVLYVEEARETLTLVARGGEDPAPAAAEAAEGAEGNPAGDGPEDTEECIYEI